MQAERASTVARCCDKNVASTFCVVCRILHGTTPASPATRTHVWQHTMPANVRTQPTSGPGRSTCSRQPWLDSEKNRLLKNYDECARVASVQTMKGTHGHALAASLRDSPSRRNLRDGIWHVHQPDLPPSLTGSPRPCLVSAPNCMWPVQSHPNRPTRSRHAHRSHRYCRRSACGV
jgi:hypothetical protein